MAFAHVPADGVCFWDFDAPATPDTPRDTSATAIAAAALVKLPALTGEARYRAAAARTVGSLADGHLDERGGLADGCHNGRTGYAAHHELIWGDYFLLEAALGLDGTLSRPETV